MKIRWLIAVLTLLQVCGAYGASFDCKKAVTKIEKLICSEPSLNEADTQMGESYKNAVKAFPIPEFVQTTQKLFLSGFKYCNDDKDKKASIESCRQILKDRITELNDYAKAKVYARSKNKYSPEDVVLTLSGTGNNTVLRYFGSWMPDGNKPQPFPHGYICNDAVKLTLKKGELLAEDSTLSTLKMSEDKINMSVMCNPRTSINGEFSRIK
jgi:uncharacterized protein